MLKTMPRDKFEILAEIYNSLPHLKCQGKCQDSCGVIPVFEIEVQNIKRLNLNPPSTVNSSQYGELTCSQLSAFGTCKIYSSRPLACRLFGLVEKMRCPFGCVPERWLTDEETDKLMEKLIKLSGGVPKVIT